MSHGSDAVGCHGSGHGLLVNNRRCMCLYALDGIFYVFTLLCAVAQWLACWTANRVRFVIQIPTRADIRFEISASLAPPSQLSYDEYTDRTLSVGR